MGKYNLVWRNSTELVEVFLEGEEFFEGQSVIHFGCGAGRSAKAFMAKGLNTTLVDLSPYCLDEEVRELLALFGGQVGFVQGCLWDLPEIETADWIFCADVLHTVPEEKVDGVLEAMAAKMRYGGFLSIKKNSHPTPKEGAWWEHKIQKHFYIVGEDVLADNGLLCFRLRTFSRP